MGLVLATSGYVPTFDAADFALHARMIGEAGGYPPSFPGSESASAFRPPAYPHLLAGLWEVTGRSVPVWLWLVPVLSLASTVAVIGNPRYRLPLDPFLVLAAAVVLAELAARRTGEPAPSARLLDR